MPRGHSLLVGHVLDLSSSDTFFWVCETLPSISLGMLFGRFFEFLTRKFDKVGPRLNFSSKYYSAVAEKVLNL